MLSDHFYYFGDKPELLPEHLSSIVRQGQGHKSTANQPYLHDFVEWILTQIKAKNRVYSEPFNRHLFTLDSDYINKCASRDKQLDDMDEELHDE